MLGYIIATERGLAGPLLAEVVDRLRAAGWPLAGALQPEAEACLSMQLRLLSPDRVMQISQSLGPMASGCRLDTGALAAAAGLVEASLVTGARLLILNKFGKAEAEGGGFRPLIGQALARGIPVLTSVAPDQLAAFEAFADGLAEALPADADAILRWCAAADARC